MIFTGWVRDVVATVSVAYLVGCLGSCLWLVWTDWWRPRQFRKKMLPDLPEARVCRRAK